MTVEEGQRAEVAEEVMEAAMAEEKMTEAAMVYGMKVWASDIRRTRLPVVSGTNLTVTVCPALGWYRMKATDPLCFVRCRGHSMRNNVE